MTTIDFQAARKLLFGWEGLACVGLLALMWFFLAAQIQTVHDIVAGAPTFRIYPLAIVGAGVFAMVLSALATGILAAIRVRPSIAKLAGRLMMFLVWLNVPIFVFSLIFVGPIQRYYFHKNGYTECDQLRGSPSVMFTDWVKNPEWCVRGKDRAWVFEQARATQENPAKVNATN